ncbi:UNVERIFIED_CONTAM: hypothetical protein K2H54_046281 [Gekko kuhli]
MPYGSSAQEAHYSHHEARTDLFITKGFTAEHFLESPPMKFLLFLAFMSTILGHSYTFQNCTNTCHEHAKCELRNGVQGCYCSPGFTGPGITGPDKPGCYGESWSDCGVVCMDTPILATMWRNRTKLHF